MSRRGRKKNKTVPLSTFIGNDEPPQPAPQSNYSYRGRRDGEVVLPQGPRASRAVDVDLSRLPSDPPFHILISNLSYDSEENKLREHLGFIKEMGDVTWNYKDGRRDGTAFVEFNSRDGAVAALGQTDTVFGGRKIVINVAERNAEGELMREPIWRKRDSESRWEHDMYPQRGSWRESRGGSRYYGDDSSEPRDDWRSREQSNGGRDGFHSNREYSRDGYRGNREHSRDGYRGNREHSRDGFRGNRETGDSSDRDSWRSRDRDSSSFSSGQRYRGRGDRGQSPRSSSPGGDESPEGSRWSYSRGREDRRGGARDDSRPWRGRGGNSYQRSHDRESSEEPESWRRSVSDRQDRTPERRRQTPPSPSPESQGREPSSAGTGIFGGARPVDTSVREKEMEEKMSRLETQSPGDQQKERGFGRDRGYNREERGYNRDERGYREERGFRDERGFREERGFRGEDRGSRGGGNESREYRREFRKDRREFRGDKRDRRGQYRSEGEGEGDRGPRRAPEARSAPRGIYKEQEQPEFAKNTRFSLLESEDTND